VADMSLSTVMLTAAVGLKLMDSLVCLQALATVASYQHVPVEVVHM
jgi:hypothetical protein